MFLNIDKHYKNKTGIVIKDNEGHALSYAELADIVKQSANMAMPRSVIFVLCKNTVGCLVGYLSSVEGDSVPLMLSSKMDKGLLNSLLEEYSPSYLWVPSEMVSDFPFKVFYEQNDYSLLITHNQYYPIHNELQLLMTTSGSTGSPKLVRYKKGNLEANAKNVASAFSWTSDERAVCDLGMQYTMGLNVINSHLKVGASILLTTYNLMSSDFWNYIRSEMGSNFTGVPFSYDILLRLHFEKMDLPCLRTFAQGGGKLTDSKFKQLAEYAQKNRKRFIATFGTTETAARMTYLSPEFALSKIGSIGKAIPEGELFLINTDGNILTDSEAEGELCYRGPNVTMGYAVKKEDLLKGDEFKGEYHTGDLARRDADGFYYITGRMSRFLKLLSYRVSLDQCEKLIQDHFNIECACTGSDQRMDIYITDDEYREDVLDYICEKTNLFKTLFKINVIDSIPRTDSGKIQYKLLKPNI